MSFDKLSPYREIWLVDFEFRPVGGQEGSLPDVICIVAHELRSGRTIRLRKDQLGRLPPYPTDEDVLFVAYYASAEVGCHLVLNWPIPLRILDIFTEFRNLTNGLSKAAGLIDALAYYRLDHMGAHEKAAMRDLILSGGPWSDAQWFEILEYCEADVVQLSKLLPAMLPNIDLPRALIRGRSMAAAARMEHNGAPIDVHTLRLIETYRETIKDGLRREIDKDFGVYDGPCFREKKFADWLKRRDIAWPHDSRGRLRLDDETFRTMARAYPEVAPLRQLRAFLSETRSSSLPVGVDNRNRASSFGNKRSTRALGISS
jgi:hypothetical protein